MTFLNSMWLWGPLAAAGVAVPIIIHLINRFRQRQIDWAAMDLLRRAISVRSRQIRLEDLLLLVLRCLALLLIALALARPTLSGSAAKLLPGGKGMGVLVALDGSFSMAHRVGYSRFEKAKERVNEIFGTLEEGVPVTLVVMGNQPHVLLRNEGYNKQRFEKVLEEASVRPEGLNLEACLRDLEAMALEIKAPSRECYFVSDGQVLTWKNLSDPSKRYLKGLGTICKVFFLTAGAEKAENAENLALTRLELASGALRKGNMVRYDAVVQNFGQKPQRATVSLSADNHVVDQRVEDILAPGQSKTVPLHFWCSKGGDVRLTAQLGPDALTTDNTRHAVAHVYDRMHVLCVDGQPLGFGERTRAERPYQSETFYLMTALLPRKNLPEPSLVVRRISSSELPGQPLGEYDVLILANVPDIRPETVQAMYGFVEQGGGLIFFLGNRTDLRVFNPPKVEGAPPGPASAAEGLTPGELVEMVRASGIPGGPGGSPDRASGSPEGWSVESARTAHPLCRVVESLPVKLMEEARVQQYFKLRPNPHARVILRVSGTRDPLLVERNVGRGKVLVFTTTANREWGDLAIHPIYPILLHQALTLLTSRPNERPFTVGQPLTLPLPRLASSEKAPTAVAVRHPGGEESQVAVVHRGGKLGEPVVEYDKMNAPGFYEIRWKGTENPVVAACNVDPLESDVTAMDSRGLSAALADLPLRVVAEGQDIAGIIREVRVGRELWRELLILAVAVLVLESLLARRFTRRMSGDESEELLGTQAALAGRTSAEKAA